MPVSSGGLATASGLLIVDSWPAMEWLKGRQPLAADFLSLLANARNHRAELLMSSINLGEIFYNCWNEWSEARAEKVLGDFAALPIRIVHPTLDDALAAARIKGRHRISYADAFATVLAVKSKAPILSGDPDFLKLRDRGVVEVVWLGK